MYITFRLCGELRVYEKHCLKGKHHISVSGSSYLRVAPRINLSGNKGYINPPKLYGSLISQIRHHIHGRLRFPLKIYGGAIGRVLDVITIHDSELNTSFSGETGNSINLKPIRSTKDISILLDKLSVYLPELSIPILNETSRSRVKNQDRIQINILKDRVINDISTGYRSNWLIGQVFLDNRLIMFILNDGYADDAYDYRYILEPQGYQELIFYLWSLLQPDLGGDGPKSISGTIPNFVYTTRIDLGIFNNLPKSIRTLIGGASHG
jgi:hypothetical protein